MPLNVTAVSIRPFARGRADAMPRLGERGPARTAVVGSGPSDAGGRKALLEVSLKKSSNRAAVRRGERYAESGSGNGPSKTGSKGMVGTAFAALASQNE